MTRCLSQLKQAAQQEAQNYRPMLMSGLRTGGLAVLGGLGLWPLVNRLPMLGWDWAMTFQNNDGLVHPPYLHPTLAVLTWLPWRDSLGLLNSLTLITLALAVWKHGGRFGTILFALLTPPLWMVLWDGQLDGLILLGIISEVPLLVFLKPNIGPWSLFKHWGALALGAVFFLITLWLWSLWFLRLGNVAFGHPAAMGWGTLGWPILLVGLGMLLGAGPNPYRLMAAGCLISPYLMPYHFLLLTPALGAVRGYRQIMIFLSLWLTLLSLGLGGWFRWLGLLCPLSVYGCLHHWPDYLTQLRRVCGWGQRVKKAIFLPREPFKN
jgi:hypothetical protein